MTETRYNTITETDYKLEKEYRVRTVPVTRYETEYRVEEVTEYRTEYETAYRSVPIEKTIVVNHSDDSGDGVESEPEGHGHQGYDHYYA